MILRIVRGVVPQGALAQLAEGFATSYLPIARGTPGLVRFHVAARPTGDVHQLVVVTFWTSVDAALAAYGGDLDNVRTLGRLDEHADLTSVAHFEVDESQLRRSTADAAILRISIGRIAQGGDAAIQQEIRTRTRELGDAMTEAYVGRRIVGTDVEVAFVSAWQHAPAGTRLDEPLWPALSARYDTFGVETYDSLLSSASAGV